MDIIRMATAQDEYLATYRKILAVWYVNRGLINKEKWEMFEKVIKDFCKQLDKQGYMLVKSDRLIEQHKKKR